MIDAKLLHANPDQVRVSQYARGLDPKTVDVALATDSLRRYTLTHLEDLRTQHNTLTRAIRDATTTERPALIQATRDLAPQIAHYITANQDAEAAHQAAMDAIPNIIQEGTPAGGENDYITLREVGTPPTFDFTPQDHLTLATNLGALDMQRGAKVAGARFHYLRGPGYQLQKALFDLATDIALEADFIPMTTPTLVRPNIMAGTGFLGAHTDEIYHLPADDLYLTGTSEVALAGYHADEILDLTTDDIRYLGHSTCYRREAGAHGKDTRGIIRVHQFEKLELFIYTTPNKATATHEAILAIQENLMTRLNLPYRVIDTAAGDLGTSAARKYDIEAWVPTQHTWREVTSTSNCTTYQARRLGIRHHDGTGNTPVATLNGTLATTRMLVPIIENNQQADGNVTIPTALQPYMRGKTHLR